MSSWNTLKYRLTGACPIVFHNARLSNPLDAFAKDIKKITSKKKKTEADYERLAELEFKGGMYVGENKEPVLIAEGTEAIIRAGARKSKEGKVVESGVICTKHAPLEYEGPKDVDELWKDEKFRLQAIVKNPTGGGRTVRTRPMFPIWSAVVELQYNQEVCNEEQVKNWLTVAGEQCGAFDWRPKYGRFKVEKVV
jgi:hypothetical protein